MLPPPFRTPAPSSRTDRYAASGIAFQVRGTDPGFHLFVLARGGGPSPSARLVLG